MASTSNKGTRQTSTKKNNVSRETKKTPAKRASTKSAPAKKTTKSSKPKYDANKTVYKKINKHYAIMDKEPKEYTKEWYVKKATEEVQRLNNSLYKMRKSGEEESVFLTNEIRRLQQMGKATKEGFILVNPKASKAEVQQFVYELSNFRKIDIETPAGRREFSRRESKAYREFKSKAGHGGISKDEWRQLVDIFGALGKSILTTLGSEQIVERFKNASDDQRVNLVKYAQESLKEEGKTVSQRLDILDTLIKNGGNK